MILGVTGRYCAGKDTVVAALARRGFREIDVDRIGHTVLDLKIDEVVRRFGDEVRAGSGRVDRRRLGAVVFRDPGALRALEAIVHPEMIRRVAELAGDGGERLVINAAILHRMGLHRLCHVVVCVAAPFPVRLRRAMRRDHLSFRAAARRLLGQRDVCPKRAPGAVDTVTVRNAGSREALLDRLEYILRAKGVV